MGQAPKEAPVKLPHVLTRIANATKKTSFEGDVFLVGGAVRDALLGRAVDADFDLVTRGSASELAALLHDQGLSTIAPVTYERFGTAMVQIDGTAIELVTARKESYDPESRKPRVEAATYHEDALRRDFTVNTLMVGLDSGELVDPLGSGLRDLEAKVLRTPLDPVETFRDDPLRMLRAVRFRWKLGFEPAPGIYDAIRASRARLEIVSFERIRDEFLKMLDLPDAPRAVDDLMQLGLMSFIAPETLAMVDCEQGKFHHLDVWNHSLLVLKNAIRLEPPGGVDRTLRLAALLHDVGKPPTRHIDEEGNTRFFGHEAVGQEMTRTILRRLKLSERKIDHVAKLVKNHMRLGSSPTFTALAARRLIRDMGDELARLLLLVEADAGSLRPGVRVLDLEPIRARLETVSEATPRETLQSPLTGEEIMAICHVAPGPEVGRLKNALLERVLEGILDPNDRDHAKAILSELAAEPDGLQIGNNKDGSPTKR